MLDVLCDVVDNPGRTIALPGCVDVTALNMAGPAPAAVDAVARSIPVPRQLRTSDAGRSEVDVRFAGLGGYLLAKSAAFLARSLDKDVYDFAFVLTYNAGGGRAAADAMRSAIPAPPLRDYLADAVAVLRRLTGADAREREIFCEQMLLSGADEDRAVLNQDVYGAALDCLNRLAESGPRGARPAAQPATSTPD